MLKRLKPGDHEIAVKTEEQPRKFKVGKCNILADKISERKNETYCKTLIFYRNNTVDLKILAFWLLVMAE